MKVVIRPLLPFFVAAVLLAQNPVAEAVKLIEDGKPGDALPLLKAAAESSPKDPAVQFHLALAYSLLDQDAEAIPVYQKVLALQPGLYEAQLNLARLFLRQQRPAEARPLLEAAAAKKPAQFRPHYLLGETLLALNDPASAEAAFRAAAEADPKSADALIGLARAQLAGKRPSEAAATLEQAAALAPADPNIAELTAAAREQAGLAKLTEGDPKAAVAELEAAMAKAPTSALQYALATAYLRDNQRDKALALAAALVQREPKNNELHMFYGRLLRDAKRYSPAAQQFYLVTQADSAHAEAWNELAAMLILLEQHAQALTALDKVKALSGETPAYWYFRATILDAAKDYKPALEGYRRFLDSAGGKFPDEEFKARQRARIVQKILSR